MNCVRSWQVYNFGSYTPIRSVRDVSHTAIQITYRDGESRVYEWGGRMPYDDFKQDGDDYKYPDRSWSGVEGQSGTVPNDRCITREMIDEANENWRAEHDAGGQYPSNCRGYAHYIIRYMMGSNDPDTPLPHNDPMYHPACASSQSKRKTPSNNREAKRSKKGGKRITRSRVLKRRTMKIRRTNQ